MVEAVAAGKFRIFAVETIDEGIELLTGIEAGVLGEDGRYPPETINRRVADYLDTLAKTQRSFQENGQVKS